MAPPGRRHGRGDRAPCRGTGWQAGRRPRRRKRCANGRAPRGLLGGKQRRIPERVIPSLRTPHATCVVRERCRLLRPRPAVAASSAAAREQRPKGRRLLERGVPGWATRRGALPGGLRAPQLVQGTHSAEPWRLRTVSLRRAQPATVLERTGGYSSPMARRRMATVSACKPVDRVPRAGRGCRRAERPAPDEEAPRCPASPGASTAAKVELHVDRHVQLVAGLAVQLHRLEEHRARVVGATLHGVVGEDAKDARLHPGSRTRAHEQAHLLSSLSARAAATSPRPRARKPGGVARQRMLVTELLEHADARRE